MRRHVGRDGRVDLISPSLPNPGSSIAQHREPDALIGLQGSRGHKEGQGSYD